MHADVAILKVWDAVGRALLSMRASIFSAYPAKVPDISYDDAYAVDILQLP